jgi:ABC-2 type transport system ATP-binding protein
MSEVIEVHDLHKNFGHVAALNGLNLEVAEGEIHGFLGPNGAGKSTTIRILLGIMRASSGRAELLGRDPWTDAVALHRELAYVPGDVTLWPSLSGGETIDLLARMRGGINQERRAELIERFDLDPRKKARTYSKGNRQKVALVAAFASDVELLLLDEPTSGLDPLMEEQFREVVREERRRGDRTVLLSSHILAEVEKLCDNITIIRAGRAVKSGTLEELRHLMRTTITVRTRGDALALQQVPYVHDFGSQNSHVRFSVDRNDLDFVMEHLTELGIEELTVTPASLEDLFLREYQGVNR